MIVGRGVERGPACWGGFLLSTIGWYVERWPNSSNMTTIAPIKGMIRKRLFFDLTVSLGGGTLAAYAFWYVLLLTPGMAATSPACSSVGIPILTAGDAFYAKLNAEKE